MTEKKETEPGSDKCTSERARIARTNPHSIQRPPGSQQPQETPAIPVKKNCSAVNGNACQNTRKRPTRLIGRTGNETRPCAPSAHKQKRLIRPAPLPDLMNQWWPGCFTGNLRDLCRRKL